MALATETRPAVRPTEHAQWYMDAIIYQLHVRAFFDDNADGIGDFRGLTAKLDYIQRLGVNAIWLLPFFPSPLKDDGYDIADYTRVNPIYGNLRDFRVLLREAHRRGLKVITELVMNHTSDQHAWFQRSRRAKPGSKYRDYYVWSDNPHRYKQARIIFQDFEASNWTWDPVAQAYFWHRFYSHQPDLNFDNPEVRKEMFRVIDFWMDMGVDGVRLDAVPYLFEREGTNCENLPETHEFLRQLRRHVDQHHPSKMLLAEANQWPEDAAAYFGNGDECHMNFHFPLMPRLFMAIEREDRFPVIDILEQTPSLPPGCQWAIFLRNHDELTLEMVTDEERDYMYRTYAEDPQARLNLGIRRRLAPLLRNNRRKFELMKALLLSLPGTPILYYGDEIGMGDNIYLGDRNGVRTPMQWSADRNAGFSRANPQKLYLPVIIDSEFHYATCNVEVEENSPHSLLWWMRRIIELRRQTRAFGRGSLEFLRPANAKVLAFLRKFEGETLLVIANLSRFSQYAELDLSAYRGQVPVEMFGRTRFPAIGELPYFITLGPYAFYWFRLQWASEEAVDQSPQHLPLRKLRGPVERIFAPDQLGGLQSVLPAFLQRHRWFAGKAQTLRGVEVVEAFEVPTEGPKGDLRLLMIRADYADADSDLYLLPVVMAEEEQARNILGDHPAAGILEVQDTVSGRQVTLCDATWEREFWRPLLEMISRRRTWHGRHGALTAVQTRAFRRLASPDLQASPPTVHGGQQSNTSAVFNNQLIFKLFRRVQAGLHPDWEIGRFLTEHTALAHVPKVAGALEYQPHRGETMTWGILHEYRENQGDAWTYTLDELNRYFERVRTQEEPVPLAPQSESDGLLELAQLTPSDGAREIIGTFLQMAELLGQRTAQMHAALVAQDQPAFTAEPFTKLYRRSLYQAMRTQARRGFQLLQRQREKLHPDTQPMAEQVLQAEPALLGQLAELLHTDIAAMRIRCHGDYHLGQVLFTGKDFVIIDFEGEPGRPLTERRIKTSPLKDVAGMIRSFHYAAHAARFRELAAGLPPANMEQLQLWADVWYRWTASTFLRAYLAEIAPAELLPSDPHQLRILLNAYILQKMVYELSYELNNRPDWVILPLQGILEIC